MDSSAPGNSQSQYPQDIKGVVDNGGEVSLEGPKRGVFEGEEEVDVERFGLCGNLESGGRCRVEIQHVAGNVVGRGVDSDWDARLRLLPGRGVEEFGCFLQALGLREGVEHGMQAHRNPLP